MAFIGQRCRVNVKYGNKGPKGCPYNHLKHKCKHCGSTDADHRSSYCPTQHTNTRCRVYAKYGSNEPKGCPYHHTTHTCKHCGSTDSDHRSSYCPTQVTQHKQMRCRVHAKYGSKQPNGCPYDHATHTCKHCGSKDSSHRSAYCPKVKNNDDNKQKGCRVKDCDETHSKHYCRLCGDHDSDHFSKNCDTGIELCHGTKMENMPGISKAGLFPSTKGRLGAGIYFTEEQYANKIAQHRGKGTGRCVIYCTVNLGNMKDVGHGEDRAGSWQNNGYDSCQSMHPKWAGVKQAFPEWCLKNKRKCRIRKVELVDVVINGDIDLANAKIVLKGKCKLKGKVIAGTVESE